MLAAGLTLAASAAAIVAALLLIANSRLRVFEGAISD
jgi:hypothetical protein